MKWRSSEKVPADNKRTRGNHFETAAARHLTKHGLQLLETNYRSRLGEIDLIMCQDTTLVFVEVRYRKTNRFGGAAGSITPQKQRKIALTALHYLQTTRQTNTVCRFDAVTISATSLEWIKDAFQSPL